MDSPLTGQAVQNSYKDVLQVSNSNAGIDATLRAVEDGEGTASILQLSTAQVNINQTPGDHRVAPGLAFGDGNTGFYESSANVIAISHNQLLRWIIQDASLGANAAGGGVIAKSGASATVPSVYFSGDADTGMGKAAADQLSLIAGGVEGIRIHEATSVWIVQRTPASAPADATLIVSSASFYLDESGHNLMVKVKYADTTVKSGTVCAVA